VKWKISSLGVGMKREHLIFGIFGGYQTLILSLYIYATEKMGLNISLLFAILPSVVLFSGLALVFLLKKALAFWRSILVLNSPLGLTNRLVERDGESLYFYGISTRGFAVGFIVTRPLIREKTTFILAGSYKEYWKYVKENGLVLKSNIFYLDDHLRLRGYLDDPQKVRIIRIGDWHKNPASHDPDILRFEKQTKSSE
jgi:hypothetical protein